MNKQKLILEFEPDDRYGEQYIKKEPDYADYAFEEDLNYHRIERMRHEQEERMRQLNEEIFELGLKYAKKNNIILKK